jgi:hypothetical protein
VAEVNWYGFAAPGGVTVRGSTTGTLHFGGGGEKIFGPGIGVGGELGVLGPWSNYRSALGVFSVNGSYHFFRDRPKLDPFVTGGYTLFFRSGTANLGNFGGGVNYWLGERLALRAEVRDHVHSPGPLTIHYWGLRLGVAFRH